MSTYNIQKRKSPLIILNMQLKDFFQGTPKGVRNSGGKRAISVRATEDLLYKDKYVRVNGANPNQTVPKQVSRYNQNMLLY